jgi:phosphoribosylformimino-5-aminoimidazole carboxamide ribonucleotide (ProFAR) isomerase
VLERVLHIVQARVRWFLMVEMESVELRRARARIGMAEQVVEEVRSEVVVAGGIADQAESECLRIEEVEEGIG